MPLHRGTLADGAFLDGQDLSAYIAPAAVLNPLPNWALHHAEPFGPLDSIVLVDTEAELLAATRTLVREGLVRISESDESSIIREEPPVNEQKLKGLGFSLADVTRFIDARTPPAFMSFTRSWMSWQPMRISENAVGSMPYSSGGRPDTALRPMLGSSCCESLIHHAGRLLRGGIRLGHETMRSS